MTITTRLPVGASIVALRLHSRRPGADAPNATKVAELVDLGAREARREAEGKFFVDVVAAMKRTIGEVPKAVSQRLDEIAAIAVELGLGIAREVVGVAIDRGDVDPLPTVVRCLRDCVHGSSSTDLTVRLHPEDLELVKSRIATMPEVADEAAAARFVADPKVPRGGVHAETEAGRLRWDPRSAVARICEEVRRGVAT